MAILDWYLDMPVCRYISSERCDELSRGGQMKLDLDPPRVTPRLTVRGYTNYAITKSTLMRCVYQETTLLSRSFVSIKPTLL